MKKLKVFPGDVIQVTTKTGLYKNPFKDFDIEDGNSDNLIEIKPKKSLLVLSVEYIDGSFDHEEDKPYYQLVVLFNDQKYYSEVDHQEEFERRFKKIVL